MTGSVTADELGEKAGVQELLGSRQCSVLRLGPCWFLSGMPLCMHTHTRCVHIKLYICFPVLSYVYAMFHRKGFLKEGFSYKDIATL